MFLLFEAELSMSVRIFLWPGFYCKLKVQIYQTRIRAPLFLWAFLRVFMVARLDPGQQDCGPVQAARGPTEGELNVEAFEGQLQAVEQLAASLFVKTVLMPTPPESNLSQLVSQAVAAQIHSLESLLESYCAAQQGVSLQIVACAPLQPVA